MKEQNVELVGEGGAQRAYADMGKGPLADLPLLRHIPFRRKRVVLDSSRTILGGSTLEPDERALFVVQDGERAHAITSKWISTYDGNATIDYFVRTFPLERETLSTDQRKFHRVTYYSFPPKMVPNLFYDGDENKPMVAFRNPGNSIGHKGSFVIEYSALTAMNLDSLESTDLLKMARDVKHVNLEGISLFGATVPTSTVPNLIGVGGRGVLENAFQEEDLDIVARLNETKDKDHAPFCWGTHSCIGRETFEIASPKGYPAYELTLDASGRIYTASRILNK